MDDELTGRDPQRGDPDAPEGALVAGTPVPARPASDDPAQDLPTHPTGRLPDPLTPAAQAAAALAALALVSPAALGGMPVLPVAMEDERRRRQDEIQQQSDSSVGAHHSLEEAATALSLSQSRLAAVTREIEHSTRREVTEEDVVSAAHAVVAGEATPRQRRRFRSALGMVACDAVDLFILAQDEDPEQPCETSGHPSGEEDLEAWLEEFA